jgi:hydroxymethylbilane synthase
MPDASRHARLTSHRHALPLRVGTRGSPLALLQTAELIGALRDFWPALRATDTVETHAITTTGDTVQDRILADIGGKGLFAKEIHEALADGRIDCAVHSLKDLETELPPGIWLACVLRREDARDALILGNRCPHVDPTDSLAALPRGAVVGTASVRRRAQLLHARPDLRIVPIRGNVQSRLAKLRNGDCDATVLALAGLLRLGLAETASAVLDPDLMVPAAAQGIIGVTIRAGDGALRDLLAPIEDPDARAAALAERALLAELDGTCQTPIGGHARLLANDRLILTGMVAREDGSFLVKRQLEGTVRDVERIGQTLGTCLRADAMGEVFW